jgi:hypothetical protein
MFCIQAGSILNDYYIFCKALLEMSPTRKNNMRKNKKSTRKGSRKAGRKGSRKDRKGSRKDRKDRKNRKQTGGNPMEQSLAQGRQFAEIHSAQHGGAYLTGAPISQIDGSMLEPGLRDFARVGGLDASVAEASTQRDPDQMAQSGGRRNRKASKKSKKNRKASKKSKKNRKASKKSKKNRKAGSRRSRQAGGALTGAPFNQPTMLLTSAEAAKAGTADFSNPLLKH